ncbi:ligase-associated DNA damage response endonuclease PdeM [Jannaschia sp. M317]|uniref:ligase-associated DNA damage response endonuclease PdeM n=1 Tax=Jannaschia sp. M317 TaxID=2867011 RepID=UPI0021A6E63D|nr:ligase-associated DNA damage response endonuclease PdeM [Jannaschia sp. M317]UWQ17542.1 ligase-associated DNA damage response endonuclease PdeM [Jannaschia sp. M317]
MANHHPFSFAGERLIARASGALHWPAHDVLVVSDLHLGKSERHARRDGRLLPPYEVIDTLRRLQDDVLDTGAGHVVLLGDSFDDLAAAEALAPDHRDHIARLMAGRDWTWITGNHDPAPPGLPGRAVECLTLGPLTFCHIATDADRAEVSGHYHPKAAITLRGRAVTRPCFLRDDRRLILPAYGTYTGGLRSRDPALTGLMGANARAILAGQPMVEIPMPR